MGKAEFIKHDKWLSEILARDVYSFHLDDEVQEHLNDPGSTAFKGLSDVMKSGPVFIFCKIPARDTRKSVILEKAGFRLVDTSVTFEKDINCFPASGNNMIRKAQPDDAAGVSSVAENSFVYSRFHLDPAIPDKTADRVKAEWAGNYFRGLRGDSMIISEDGGRITGFLQLLVDGKKSITIDLIAVEKNCRNKGVATDLIAMAESENPDCRIIRVGTQVANTPSIRMYERLGFRLVQSQYIFHYHG